jgi:hypothetical protein
LAFSPGIASRATGNVVQKLQTRDGCDKQALSAIFATAANLSKRRRDNAVATRRLNLSEERQRHEFCAQWREVCSFAHDDGCDFVRHVLLPGHVFVLNAAAAVMLVMRRHAITRLCHGNGSAHPVDG